MPVTNNQESVIRRYLLGQLSDDDQELVEQRLLMEDDFFEELEIGKDELVDEYFHGQLLEADSLWFEQNYLASSEGKRRLGFSKALRTYVRDHPKPQKSVGFFERLANLWSRQPILVGALASLAALVLVVGLWVITRSPAPTNFATLTLPSVSSTRSTGPESQRTSNRDQGLRLILLLPESVNEGGQFRVELSNDKGLSRILQPTAQTAQSVTVEIPAGQLAPGQYAIILKMVNDRGEQRIPGTYYFNVEP